MGRMPPSGRCYGLASNGSAGEFMRQAGGGTANNAAGTCRIRMGGGDADAVETVVCDNGFDQAIGGGSIVVHTK